jgi:hypothetical protein
MVLVSAAVMLAALPAGTFAGATDALDANVVAAVRAAGEAGCPDAEVTVMRLITPTSSSHVTPSTTGRKRSG